MGAASVPLILSVMGTAAAVYGTMQQAKAQKRVAGQEARAAEQARKIAAQRAKDEGKRHKAILATQKARYAASGVTMEGSPLLVQMESLRESEEQLKRIREGGEVEYMTHQELAQAAGKRARTTRVSGYATAVTEAGRDVYRTGRTYDWW